MTPGRRAVAVRFALGAGVALVLLLSGSRGDVDRMVYGDGEIHRYIASHITAAPSEVDHRVAIVGTSLRYGRIGLPGVIWLLSGGSVAAMRFVHPLVIVLAAGAAAAALGTLMPSGPPGAALLVYAVPGFTLSVAGGYAEVLALALALSGLWFALRRSWWPASALLGIAVLTKENAGAVLLGALAWGLWRMRDRHAWILLAGPAIPAAWHGYVRARYGSFPLLDPYLRSPTGMDAPGSGLVRSLTDAFSSGALVAVVVHVALAVVVCALARRSVFGAAGAFASLQLLSASPWAWRFVGDAIRISTFIEAGALLAVLAVVRPSWFEPAALASPRLEPAPA